MHKNTASITVSIVGARGYSGLELVKLLLKHPAVNLTHCFATQNFSLSQYIDAPNVKNVTCLPDTEIEKNLTDFVFLTTPAEVSMELAPKILKQGKKVIDLSGAFRLKTNDYKKWYGFEHTQKNLLTTATYGLMPWAGPTNNVNLIANPGCYASAALMGLLPLIKNNIIDTSSIVIDAKSGTSGAGRKATENLLFTEVDGECLPYKVGRHQHLPEIQEAVKNFAQTDINPHFTTSLLATRRGIIAGIYTKLNSNMTLANVQQAYETSYTGNSLVEFASVKTRPELLSLKRVVGTAKTHIAYEVEGNKLFVFSLIDNLVKGAAGQAVENLNQILDLPVATGLSHLEATL